tara:strand:+ start:2229 stop:3215 length:987 start_codon:yes stop_codon:yes gene_type:complete
MTQLNEGNFVLFAYEFDGKGGAKPLTGKEVDKQIKAKKLAWVHLDATASETEPWLRENVDYLDSLIIDALLAEETRPRVTFFGKGAMVILRGMNLQENADPEDMISIRLWIDESRIISLRRRPLKAVQDIRDNLDSGKGPKDAGAFLAMLGQRLFERMQPVLFELGEEIDDIEESMLEDVSSTERQRVNEVRRKALIFKRYISPQKDVMASLRNAEMPWIHAHTTRRFQENQDRLTRYLEDLDSVRERAQIIKEEYTNILSDRMNKNTYALSLIAGIFLPLGFLTGLLGINVGGMPGVNNPLAFWIVVGLCVLCGGAFIGLFKILKWL